jgi:hypothetical protein
MLRERPSSGGLFVGCQCPCAPLVFAGGTYCYQLGSFPMISPVNIAIYAFGGFMLFALAIGFFAAPV